MLYDPIGGVTAEDALDAWRAWLTGKVQLAEFLRPLYPTASEAQQILMMGPLDEAHEAERLLGALAVARRHLEMNPEPHGFLAPRNRPDRPSGKPS